MEHMIDFFAIGFYAAVVTYGLIVVWTVLARLRWLPRILVRGLHRPLNRLGRVPVLGRVVAACRRYPLSLGLLIAIGVGVAVPYAVMSVMWLIYGLSFVFAVVVGVWAFFNGDGQSASDRDDDDSDPIWDYDDDWAAARGRLPRA